MATTTQNPGQVNNAGDRLALFLKVFSGEVLTAFERTTVTMNRHIVRTISAGKSASFPVMGRATAKYLAPGNSLDDQRSDIPHNEKVITIDGLLTADVLITDIDDAMNHYDARAEYSKQLGESLAVAADGAVIANGVAVAGAAANLPGLGAGATVALETLTSIAGASAAQGKEILDAMAKARIGFTKNRVPASDRFAYLTPAAYASVLMALMPNVANYQAIIDIQNGSLMKVHGFELIETPHFEQGGADTKHQFPTALVGKVAALCVHRSAVGTVKLKDLALERARRAEYQADQIIAKYAMGHGGLRPEAATIITAKA